MEKGPEAASRVWRDGLALGRQAPEKPRGMHWRTYKRKVAAWEATEERADYAWATSEMRVLARHRARVQRLTRRWDAVCH